MQLCTITECWGVYADACVCDQKSQLLFVSVFGRDTALKEFTSRIQLGSSAEDGLSRFRLQEKDCTVYIGNANNLEQTTGRIENTVYGNLGHMFLYDKEALGLNKATGSAWLLEYGTPVAQSRVWNTIKELADIPLLDHWCEPILQQEWPYLVDTADALGAVYALKVSLDKKFTSRICRMIREGLLTLESQQRLAA